GGAPPCQARGRRLAGGRVPGAGPDPLPRAAAGPPRAGLEAEDRGRGVVRRRLPRAGGVSPPAGGGLRSLRLHGGAAGRAGAGPRVPGHARSRPGRPLAGDPRARGACRPAPRPRPWLRGGQAPERRALPILSPRPGRLTPYWGIARPGRWGPSPTTPGGAP